MEIELTFRDINSNPCLCIRNNNLISYAKRTIRFIC